MKHLNFFLVVCFSFVLCFPLFLFPVFAEEFEEEGQYDSYDDYIVQNAATFLSPRASASSSFDNSQACVYFLELPYAQRQAIINLSHVGSDNNLVVLSTTGSVYTFNGAQILTESFSNDEPVSIGVNPNISNRGRFKINTDGTITSSGSTLNNTIKAVFYWNHNTGGFNPLGTITFDGNLCSVTPSPTSTPFPTADPFACNFALNEVISNDYVASLVAYAEKQNFTEPYYIYRVYYSDSADDMNILSSSGVYTEVEPFSIKGYVLALQGYSYPQTYVLEYKQLRKLCTDSVCAFAEFDLLDSMMYPHYELVLSSTCLERGDFSEIQATQDVNASIQQTITQNATSISNQNTMINQNQQIIDISNQTNSLLDSGNTSSQSASSLLNNITSDFNNTAADLESFESQFNSGMTAALGNIDISGGNLGNVSDFVSTADFIKLQFDTILDNSGIYKSVITFSLILGIALLLIGRRS